MSSERVIVHVDMDAFFAAVEQRDCPELIGKPVIVGSDPKEGKGRGVVATCSYEARKYGIHSAMPISKAYQLCPKGVFLRGNSAKYRKASDQIFRILCDFTPDIQPVSIDEAFLDITGSFHFYKTPYAACRKIKDRIKEEVGLTASIGIAPTKMVAKIASDYGKPDGLLEIKADEVLAFLWPLPISRLWGVGKKTQGVLNKIGIRTIGDLAQVSKASLREHLGEAGEHLFRLANGIDEREVAVDDEIKSISNEHTFEEDTSDKDQIYSTLSYLSEKVSRRLRRYDLKGRTITVKIRLKGFHTFTRAHTLKKRVNFFNSIYETSKEVFDLFYESGMKIRLLGVRVSNFEDPYVQESLFNDPSFERHESLHKAVDWIKDRFGEQAISHAQQLRKDKG